MKTYVANDNIVNPSNKKWYIIDAEGKTLGRLATVAARILIGKNKPEYTPNLDTGDFLIIVNADKVTLTGKKYTDKLYRHHTGYAGGLKEVAYKDMVVKHPIFPVEAAIRGMLPKNSLGRDMFRKLKVYSGPDHEHQAQKPEKVEF